MVVRHLLAETAKMTKSSKDDTYQKRLSNLESLNAQNIEAHRQINPLAKMLIVSKITGVELIFFTSGQRYIE